MLSFTDLTSAALDVVYGEIYIIIHSSAVTDNEPRFIDICFAYRPLLKRAPLVSVMDN